MAIKIEKDCMVRIAYRITDLDGRLFEERTPETPYEFRQGEGQINAPIECALEGKTAGFRCEINVKPVDAYGDYHPNLVAEVPIENFAQEPEVGMKFDTSAPDGSVIVVRVIEVSEDTVTVDGNHPLAGLDLIFDVQVLEVQAPHGSEAAKPTVTTRPTGKGPLH